MSFLRRIWAWMWAAPTGGRIHPDGGPGPYHGRYPWEPAITMRPGWAGQDASMIDIVRSMPLDDDGHPTGSSVDLTPYIDSITITGGPAA